MCVEILVIFELCIFIVEVLRQVLDMYLDTWCRYFPVVRIVIYISALSFDAISL